MPNPTDSMPYPEFTATIAAVPNQDPADARSGTRDGYRVMAEGTPPATVIALGSAPTQTPQPNIPYLVADQVLCPMLVGIRQRYGKPAGRNELAEDMFRLFGGDNRTWTFQSWFSDLTGETGAALPDLGSLAQLFR